MKNIIEKHIICDLYYVFYSISNIITNGFICIKQKTILALIHPVNSSLIMTYYQQNKLLVSH